MTRFMQVILTAVAVGAAGAAGFAAKDHLASLTGNMASVSPPADRTGTEAPGKRILYYRNPMGAPDTSPVPKKDSMGMDYIPVFENDDDDAGTIKLSPAKIQRLGVTTEKVTMRTIEPIVRAPGTVQLDERQIATISLRADAFVESVEDITTGSEVRKGQPLLRIYSPAISSAAAEYAAILAQRGNSNPRGSRQKLLNMAVPEEVIAEMERTGRVPLSFTWSAPRDGVVLERNVVEGMRVGPGDVLFRIADHSTVWALVDVPESQLSLVDAGQPVTVHVRAYPGRTFHGKVALVYPHLDAPTRSVRVRIELPNHDLALRPDMYVMAEIDTGSGKPVAAVPESAVIDSGDRQIVILDKGEGRFEPRAVRLGVHAGGYVEIREGVQVNDTVVSSANFLIDAESNLKAALNGLAGGSTQK
jgi:Cu(I)/Ag(I) efflux system membrane fusion protein